MQNSGKKASPLVLQPLATLLRPMYIVITTAWWRTGSNWAGLGGSKSEIGEGSQSVRSING